MLEFIKTNLRYEDGNLIRTTKIGGEKIGSIAGWTTTCNNRPYKKINIKRKNNICASCYFFDASW